MGFRTRRIRKAIRDGALTPHAIGCKSALLFTDVVEIWIGPHPPIIKPGRPKQREARAASWVRSKNPYKSRDIAAITHRRQPIFYGYSSQMPPPSESTTILSLTNGGVTLQLLNDHTGDHAVEDIWIDQTLS